MAICPFADVRLLPEGDNVGIDQPKIIPTQIILHSFGCKCSVTGILRNQAEEITKLEEHFLIDLDGTLYQAMDTDTRADANYQANRRPDGTGAISIETADNGEPDTTPWNAAQLSVIVKLCVWIIKTHPGIALRVCRTPDDPGLGYHVMFGAPGPWTPVSKTCPGKIRVKQFYEVVVPGIIRGVGMTFTPEQEKRLLDAAGKVLEYVNMKISDVDTHVVAALLGGTALDTIAARLAALIPIPEVTKEVVMAGMEQLLREGVDQT